MTPEQEQALLTGMMRSRYWKYLVAFLCDRREKLYHSTPKGDNELWMKEGAVREINQFLRAPHLILEWLKARPAALDSDAPDADAATSASGRHPNFVLPTDDL